MDVTKWLSLTRAWLLLTLASGGVDAATSVEISTGEPSHLESPDATIWRTEVGQGFRSSVRSLGVRLGGNYGIAKDPENESHHLALFSLSYGQIFGNLQSAGHWFQGNWELRGDLFAGGQFSPEGEWFVGLTPELRYNLATGSRLVPFILAGFGVTATSIGEPDLSGTFQFNERVGLGSHWFIREDMAWSGEIFYVHWSNGGMRHPNSGLNGITGLVGLTFFF